MGADGHVLFIEADRVKDSPFAYPGVENWPLAIGWKERDLLGHRVFWTYWDTENFDARGGVLEQLDVVEANTRWMGPERYAAWLEGTKEGFSTWYGMTYEEAVERRDILEQFDWWLRGAAEDWEVWT